LATESRDTGQIALLFPLTILRFEKNQGKSRGKSREIKGSDTVLKINSFFFYLLEIKGSASLIFYEGAEISFLVTPACF